jgi:hypothetical protein
MSQTWIDPTGGTGLAMINNNVEAYASGAPIFAISGDDNLSGSSENDVFVLAQPIGNDTIHSFDFAHDKVDLIAFSGLSSFFDVRTSLSENSNGDASIAEGDRLPLDGVSAASLTADDFFQPRYRDEQRNSIVIGDNAVAARRHQQRRTMNSPRSAVNQDCKFANGLTLKAGHVASPTVLTASSWATRMPVTNVGITISGAGQLGRAADTP